MNRRSFLGALGVFSILPGAGRVWRARASQGPFFRGGLWLAMNPDWRPRETFYDFLLKQYGPFPPSVPTDIPINRPSPAELQRIFS